MNKVELAKIANTVRKEAVTMIYNAKSGHPGGALSAIDIFTYLYFNEMNVDPSEPKKEDRDRFVLSKGHTVPGLYAVLAEKGYFQRIFLKPTERWELYFRDIRTLRRHLVLICLQVLLDRVSLQQ